MNKLTVITIPGGFIESQEFTGYGARVVLLDDYEEVRDALERLIRIQPVNSPVFDAIEWQEAVAQARMALDRESI